MLYSIMNNYDWCNLLEDMGGEVEGEYGYNIDLCSLL